MRTCELAIVGRRPWKKRALMVVVVLSYLVAQARSIADFGAVGDGQTVNTEAIQRTIDAVADAGGGRVEVPAGCFATGSIFLKDNVELYLQRDAVLLGSPNKADYNKLDVCPQNRACPSESSFGAHLILAIGRKNVKIAGEGTVDGNCAAFLYGPNVVYTQYDIPWRPSQMIYLVECDGVRLDGFRIRNAPYWGCYVFGCRDVDVRGLVVRQRRYPHTHNGDGLDIDCCEHVRVRDCDILACDDALTLRACADRLTRPMECRDVVVENCRLSSACTGVRLGVGDGVIRDCTLRNLKIWRTRSGFDFVSAWSKGSKGVSFRNIRIENVDLEAVIFLTMRRLNGLPDRVFDDIVFKNVRGTVEMSSDVNGGDDPAGAFGKVVFDDVRLGKGIEFRNIREPVIAGGTLERLSLTDVERKANADFYNRRLKEFWHLADGSRPNPVRIDEIVDALSEQPGLPDDRIGNRARWTESALSKAEKAELAAADRLLAASIPSCTVEAYMLWRTNKFLRSSTIPSDKRYNSTKRMKNLSALAVAECVRNDGRYLAKIAEYLEAIIVQPSWTWAPHDNAQLGSLTGKSFVIELGSSDFVRQLAIVLDRLRDRLPADLYARTVAEVERRSFSVYRDYNQGRIPPAGWWNGANNWNAVCHGNVVRAALRIVEDRRDRAAFVEAAERMQRRYLTSFLGDGYCTEGLSYWNYGFGQFLDNVLDFRRLTGGAVDLARDPVVRLAMENPKRYVLNGKVAPVFGDAESGSMSPAVMGKGCRVWPDFDRNLPDPFPVRDYLDCAQVLICRPEHAHPSESRGLFAAFKGGSNGYNHNHNDIGSYGIVLDGVRVTGDPGYVLYTRECFGPKRYTFKLIGSYGHPVPLLGDVQQRAGKAAQARLVSKSFSADRDEITFDLSAAYAGMPSNSVLRAFAYDRVGQTVTITDRVSLETAKVLSFPVVTACAVSETSRGAYVFRPQGGETRSLGVAMSVEGADWTVSRETIENHPYKSVTRLAATTVSPVRSADSRVVFSIAEMSGRK